MKILLVSRSHWTDENFYAFSEKFLALDPRGYKITPVELCELSIKERCRAIRHVLQDWKNAKGYTQDSEMDWVEMRAKIAQFFNEELFKAEREDDGSV